MAENAELKSQVTGLEAKLDMLMSQTRASDNVISDQTAAITSLTLENAKISAKAAEAVNKTHAYETRIAKLQETITETARTNEEHVKTIVKLNAELKSAQANRSTYKVIHPGEPKPLQRTAWTQTRRQQNDASTQLVAVPADVKEYIAKLETRELALAKREDEANKHAIKTKHADLDVKKRAAELDVRNAALKQAGGDITKHPDVVKKTAGYKARIAALKTTIEGLNKKNAHLIAALST